MCTSSSSGEPVSVTPSSVGVCFAMMMTPMAASMPCTTQAGMLAAMTPARRSAKAIWMAPATTPTASMRR